MTANQDNILMLCCLMGVNYLMLSCVMPVCCLLLAALSAADCTPGADGSAFFFMLVPRLLTEHLMLIMPPSVASVADCMLDDGCRL